MIDILVSHTLEESCYDDLMEKCLAHLGQNFDIDESVDKINVLLDSVLVIDTNQWKTKVEFLPCQQLFLFHQSLSLLIGAQAFT